MNETLDRKIAAPHKNRALGPEPSDLTVAIIQIDSAGNVSPMSSQSTVSYASCAVQVYNNYSVDVWVALTVSNSSTQAKQCPVGVWAPAGENKHAFTYFGSDMNQLEIDCTVKREGPLSGAPKSMFSLSDQSCLITISGTSPTQSWTICSAGFVYFDASSASESLYYYIDGSGPSNPVPTDPTTGVALNDRVASLTISSNPEAPTTSDPVVQIYHAEGSTVSIIQDPDDSSNTIAVPYAVTPENDQVTVNCVSLATGATSVTVWQDGASQGTTLSPPGGANPSSVPFPLSSFSGHNLVLSWDESGDPKVVIKTTGCGGGS